MKQFRIRLLSLTLLLTLLVATVPALAAGNVQIVKPDIFWQGDWQPVELKNLPKGAEITSVKSSKPSVIQLNDGNPWYMHGVKAGTSKITVTYKLKSGAVKTTSAVLTIKKYPNAIKYIMLNGKKLPIKPAEDIQYLAHNYKRTTSTLKVAANTGWKVDKIMLYLSKGDTEKQLDITKKNGKSVKTPASYEVIQYLILFKNTRTGTVYHSVVTLMRQ